MRMSKKVNRLKTSYDDAILAVDDFLTSGIQATQY